MLVATNVPSSPNIVTLNEALSSFETSAIIRATMRNIPQDAILHSHRRENLRSSVYVGNCSRMPYAPISGNLLL
jgi:hypothetical protein